MNDRCFYLSNVLKEMNLDCIFIQDERPVLTFSFMIDGYIQQDCVVFLEDKSFLRKINNSVSMVITTDGLKNEVLELGKGVCVTAEPKTLFYSIHNYLADKDYYIGKKWDSIIGRNCDISPNASIAPQNVKIGDNVHIGNHVDILENTEIGDNVIIRSGVAIGNPGYDYKRFNGKFIHTAHTGGVLIEDDVEIGANTCIERSTFTYEKTVIKKETKIGSQCYIAHGVCIGERVLMPNNASISGYSVVGNDVTIGPGAIISNLLNIGDDAFVALGSVVGTGVKPNEHVAGNFAMEYDKFIMSYRNALKLK